MNLQRVLAIANDHHQTLAEASIPRNHIGKAVSLYAQDLQSEQKDPDTMTDEQLWLDMWEWALEMECRVGNPDFVEPWVGYEQAVLNK